MRNQPRQNVRKTLPRDVAKVKRYERGKYTLETPDGREIEGVSSPDAVEWPIDFCVTYGIHRPSGTIMILQEAPYGF